MSALLTVQLFFSSPLPRNNIATKSHTTSSPRITDENANPTGTSPLCISFSLRTCLKRTLIN